MQIFEKGSWNLTQEYKDTWKPSPLNFIPQIIRGALALGTLSLSEHLFVGCYNLADRKFEWHKDVMPVTSANVNDIANDKIISTVTLKCQKDISIPGTNINGKGGIIKGQLPTDKSINILGTLYTVDVVVFRSKETLLGNREVDEGTYVAQEEEGKMKIYYFPEGHNYQVFELSIDPLDTSLRQIQNQHDI